MFTRTSILLFSLLMFGILLCQCDSDPSSSGRRHTQPPQDSLSRTPMADEEAEHAAVTFSHQIVAPVAMYERIKTDLAAIRSRYSDSMPQVNYRFIGTWRPGQLGLKLPVGSLEDTLWAGRGVFDSLNEVYRLDSLYTSEYLPEYHALFFEGRFNPIYLVKAYSAVPGMEIVYTSGMRAGDGSQLYIYPDSQEYKYFFRKAWGDCPAGCIYSHVYYFGSDGDTIIFRGDHLFDWQDTLRPAWADSVRMARELSEYFVQWRADSGFVWYPDTAAAWFDGEDW